MANNGMLGSARAGDYDGVLQYLEEGEDANQTGQYNLTPLHLASLHGRKEVVELLLDNGADPNALDDWRCTPLHNAAGAGFPDIVQELLEAGADTDIKSSVKSKTPIEFARDKGKFDVIPILQKYATKNRNAKKSGSGGRDGPPNGRNSSGGGGSGGGRGGNNSNGQQRGGGGGGRGRVVVRDQGVSRRGAGGAATLPGQVGSRHDDDREASAMYGGQKRDLQKQLQQIEKQEEMFRLSREHDRYREQLDIAKGKYDRDLEQLIRSMEKMQDDINNIAGQRDSELADLETRLHEVQDRMLEVERSDMSTAERDEDDRRNGRGDDRRRGGDDRRGRDDRRDRR